MEPWCCVRHVQGTLREVLFDAINVHVQRPFDFAGVAKDLTIAMNIDPRFECAVFGVVTDVAKLNGLHVGLLLRAFVVFPTDIGTVGQSRKTKSRRRESSLPIG